MNELQQILIATAKAYPLASVSDYIKLIYQNEFGNAHMKESGMNLSAELRKEAFYGQSGAHLFEKIGNGYYRIYLKNAMEVGASPDTIYKMCMATAAQAHGSQDRFLDKLEFFYRMTRDGKLPLSEGALRLYMLNYEAAGFPAVHHSAAYKTAYHPAYRVVHQEFARFFELFLRVDHILQTSIDPILIAIDGPCASGKSTLARLLAYCYDCNVFHTDDFYLRQEQRTPERLKEVGGNMDRERLMQEVLEPIAHQQSVVLRPYSCKTQSILSETKLPVKRLNIIEGSYSLHPSLRQYYQIKIALNVSDEEQLNRLKRRESRKSLEAFQELWIPMERDYISQTDLLNFADLVYNS